MKGSLVLNNIFKSIGYIIKLLSSKLFTSLDLKGKKLLPIPILYRLCDCLQMKFYEIVPLTFIMHQVLLAGILRSKAIDLPLA